MESFKRMNANSKIEICNIENILKGENQNTLILQIVPLCECDWKGSESGLKKGQGTAFLIEYISRLERDNMPANAPKNTMPRGDIDFENYLDTTINKDPFGGKWSGKTIRAVFDAGDTEWVLRAMQEMKNEFIRTKIEYIMARGGYGKVRN